MKLRFCKNEVELAGLDKIDQIRLHQAHVETCPDCQLGITEYLWEKSVLETRVVEERAQIIANQSNLTEGDV